MACGPHRSRGRICAALLLFPLVKLSSADSLFPLCQPAEVQSPAREAPGLPAKENLGERGAVPSPGRRRQRARPHSAPRNCTKNPIQQGLNRTSTAPSPELSCGTRTRVNSHHFHLFCSLSYVSHLSLRQLREQRNHAEYLSLQKIVPCPGTVIVTRQKELWRAGWLSWRFVAREML